MPSYLHATLLGLLVSVGGLTESTVSPHPLYCAHVSTCACMCVQVRHSSAALLGHMKTMSADLGTLAPFSHTILKILQCSQLARVLLSLLKTLDLLLSNGVFDVYSGISR